MVGPKTLFVRYNPYTYRGLMPEFPVMAAPLWQEIHDDLKAKIEQGVLPVGATLPSEQELADQWSVSRLTAHRALYELQRSGKVHRKRKVGTVVLPPPEAQPIMLGSVFFDASDFFQGSILASIRSAFSDQHQLAFYNTGHNALREADVLRRITKEVAGVVLYPTCAPENDSLISELVESGFPLVCIDRFPEGVECDAVITDNYASTREGLQRLIANGHSCIAHVTDAEPFVNSTHQRRKAYEDTLASIGQDPKRLIRTFPYIGPDSAREFEQMVQLVYDALHTMLHSPNPPTAVFCLRDHYAAAVAEAAEQLGLKVPDDLEIIGFIDRPSWLLRLPESVVRIEQDLACIGRIAAERIQTRLRGEALPVERIKVMAHIPALVGK